MSLSSVDHARTLDRDIKTNVPFDRVTALPSSAASADADDGQLRYRDAYRFCNAWILTAALVAAGVGLAAGLPTPELLGLAEPGPARTDFALLPSNAGTLIDWHAPVREALHPEAMAFHERFPGARLEATASRLVGEELIRETTLTVEGFRYPCLRTRARWALDADGRERMVGFEAWVGDHLLLLTDTGVLRDPAREAALTEAITAAGYAVRRRPRGGWGLIVALPDAPASRTPRAFREARRVLRGLPGVRAVEGDGLVRSCAMPSDTRFEEQWALHNTGQEGATPDADIDAPEAWDLTTGSEAVVLAVLDTGVARHFDLLDNLWANPYEIPGNGMDDDGNGLVDDTRGWDFVDEDNDPDDEGGHGTHLAGLIGAETNNSGVAGICWSVQLAAMRCLDNQGNGVVSDQVAALDYAVAMEVDVINLSWGGATYSQALHDAVQRALDKGIICVAAAGNKYDYGHDLDQQPFYPACFDLPGLITVTASDRHDLLLNGANHGAQSVDLVAPGQSVLGPHPWLSSYIASSGSSVAAGMVSGVAALLKSEAPMATPGAIKTAILDGADRKRDLGGTCATAARLNAHGAVLAIRGGMRPAVEAISILDGPAGGLGDGPAPSQAGDGILDAGETVDLSLAIRARGGPVAGLRGTIALEEANEDVTLIQTTVDFGDIPTDGLAWGASSFRLAIRPEATGPQSFIGLLTLTDEAGATWTERHRFKIDRPSRVAVAPAALTVTLQPGQSVVRQFNVRNVGLKALDTNLRWADVQATGLWHQDPTAPYSGSSCWYYGRPAERDYDIGPNEGALTIGPFHVPEAGGVISFRYRLDYGQDDHVHLQASSSGGSGWYKLFGVTVENTGGQWRTVSYEVPSHKRDLDHLLRITFKAVNGVDNDHEGLSIDDARINGEPILTTTVADDEALLQPGDEMNYTLTISADGLEDGVHETAVFLASNDSKRPEIKLPVTIQVQAGGDDGETRVPGETRWTLCALALILLAATTARLRPSHRPQPARTS